MVLLIKSEVNILGGLVILVVEVLDNVIECKLVK